MASPSDHHLRLRQRLRRRQFCLAGTAARQGYSIYSVYIYICVYYKKCTAALCLCIFVVCGARSTLHAAQECVDAAKAKGPASSNAIMDTAFAPRVLKFLASQEAQRDIRKTDRLSVLLFIVRRRRCVAVATTYYHREGAGACAHSMRVCTCVHVILCDAYRHTV